MDIKVSRPDILPAGFVGHVVFKQGETAIVGVCFEHLLIVQAPTLEQAERGMAQAIEFYLNEAVEKGHSKARIEPLSEEAKEEIEAARAFTTYVVLKNGGGLPKQVADFPVYTVGTLTRDVKQQAA